MNTARFDRLTRSLSSRRTALGGLLGGSLAVLLGVATPEETDAHTYLARCRRIQSLPRRRACLRRARAHNRTCHPQPVVTTCAGRCGTWANNCGRAITCPLCPTGRTCLYNGTCGDPCSGATCPPGCTCSMEAREGGTYCIPTGIVNCAQPPAPCPSTAGCPLGQQCQLVTCGGGTYGCVPLCPS